MGTHFETLNHFTRNPVPTLQLLVRRWDTELSRDVLAHWLDLMSASGWIPREQILGAEAAVRVPVEYVTQKARPHLLCRYFG